MNSFIHFRSISPGGGCSGNSLRRTVRTSLSLGHSFQFFRRSPDVPRPTVRYNHSRRSWVCPGVSVYWDMSDIALAGGSSQFGGAAALL